MRKRDPTLFLLAALIGMLVATLVLIKPFSVSAQYPECSTPEKLARTNGATWGQAAKVTVVINPSDFQTAEQRQAIQQGFITWQNAHQNSGVTFTFTTGSNPQGANNRHTHRCAATTSG